MPSTSVNISQEHYEWLKEHPDVNFSGIVKVALNTYINKYSQGVNNGKTNNQ